MPIFEAVIGNKQNLYQYLFNSVMKKTFNSPSLEHFLKIFG